MGVSIDREKRMYILTEFIEGHGDLRAVNIAQELPWRTRIQIALDVAKAVAYLHSRGIIHRDLKSENILISSDFSAKVCDFGFARPQDSKAPMTMCGTDWTMAPEIMLSLDYTELIDVFSYGMVLAELLSRVKPDTRHFKRVIPGFGLDDAEVRSLIQPGCPPVLVDLVLQCVSDEPELRPTFARIVDTLIGLLPDIPDAAAAAIPAAVAVAAAAVPAAAAAFPSEGSARSTMSIAPPESPRRATSLVSWESPSVGSGSVIAPTSSTLSAKLASARVEELDHVQLRRVSEGGSYHYHAVNNREYAVRVRISIESANAVIAQYEGSSHADPLAVSHVVVSDGGKALEGVVASHSSGWLATVKSVAADGEMSFSSSMSVRPAAVEVRSSELNNVTLETRIQHNVTPTVISFFASNRNQVAVEVEVSVEGSVIAVNDLAVTTSGLTAPFTVKGVVPAGATAAVPIGSITCGGPVSQSWKFQSAAAPPLPEQSSVLHGVRLIKKAGSERGTIDILIHNTRAAKVRVEINVEGPVTAGLASNPIVADVPERETVCVATLACAGDIIVEWSWTEPTTPL